MQSGRFVSFKLDLLTFHFSPLSLSLSLSPKVSSLPYLPLCSFNIHIHIPLVFLNSRSPFSFYNFLSETKNVCLCVWQVSEQVSEAKGENKESILYGKGKQFHLIVGRRHRPPDHWSLFDDGQ